MLAPSIPCYHRHSHLCHTCGLLDVRFVVLACSHSLRKKLVLGDAQKEASRLVYRDVPDFQKDVTLIQIMSLADQWKVRCTPSWA